MTPERRQKQARADILRQFLAMKSTSGFALTMPWIKQYLQSLRDAGMESADEAFQAACRQLADEGLVKYRAGRGPQMDTVAITKEGIHAIYPPADPEPIRLAVLSKFKEIGAKEGYTLPEMWLQRDYERSINELQEEILQDTLRDMASEGLVEYVAYPVPNLKITAAGLERIEEMGL